jgi:ATP-dependent Clp protease ATP-binding subunit ClpC
MRPYAAARATLQDAVYPFERFSEDARKVLTYAQKEAEESGHNYIGTEHLLLGELQVDSEARHLLERLGVDEESARATLRNVLGRGPGGIRQIVPTTRVKKVIELSFGAAQREGSSNVTPQHLLIGLMEEGEGVAAHVLKDRGVTLEAVLRGGPEPREDG